MRVAVVVVTWEALDLTRRCLAALQDQETGGGGLDLDVELLVVDNGSTDGTAAALADEVRVLALPGNTGFAGGAAAGIAATDSEVVVLVNNDAVVAPGYLLALVAPLAAEPRVGAVTGRVLLAGRWVPAGPDDDALVAADGARWRRTTPEDPAGRRLVNSTGGEVTRSGNGRDRDWLTPVEDLAVDPADERVFGFTGGSVALRRAALDDVGSFDPDLFLYYEDTELSWRLRRRGWAVRYAAGAVTDHDHAASSGTASALFLDQNEANRLRVAVRHAPWPVVARAVGRTAARTVLGPDRVRRARVLARVARAVPGELRARRAVDATATVPRAVVSGWLVPDGAPR